MADAKDKREPIVDARDCFFFAGLIAVATGLWLLAGAGVSLVGAGAVLIWQAMRGQT